MAQNLTDARLIEAIRGDDAARATAFGVLFHERGLRQKAQNLVARQLGGTDDDAKDAFQEAFILADRKIRDGNFRGESALETWFLGIVKWHFLAEKQKRARRTKLLAAAPVSAPPNDRYADPEAEAIGNERTAALDGVLGQIGEECREQLRKYGLGFSMAEIGAEQGEPDKKKIGSQVFECRQKLRKMIEKSPILTQILKPNYQ